MEWMERADVVPALVAAGEAIAEVVAHVKALEAAPVGGVTRGEFEDLKKRIERIEALLAAKPSAEQAAAPEAPAPAEPEAAPREGVPGEEYLGALARRMGDYLAKGREAVADARRAIASGTITRATAVSTWEEADRLAEWLSERGV